MFDIKKIRSHFPILSQKMNGKRLAYFDNASTTQKPKAVIDAITQFYTSANANIHRGVYALSQSATQQYEDARNRVAKFIHAGPQEIIFTKGCTESINLVAATWGRDHIKRGDEIFVSVLEHHANLVCWQELVKEKKAHLRVIPLRDDLTLDMDWYEAHLSNRTKLVCVTGQSNVLGVRPLIQKIVQHAHCVGAKVLIDGAQLIAHAPVDVKRLDCDFFAFSSHKMLGPTGVGVLYGKNDILQDMRPFLYGGDMISSVSQYSALYRESPYRFEAGTPHISGVVAFPKAIDFLKTIGFPAIQAHEKALYVRILEILSSYAQVTPFVTSSVINSTVSFTIRGVHPHDSASFFDSAGIAIRAGAHCAEPLMKRLGVSATSRISTYFYNTLEEVDRIDHVLHSIMKKFRI